jgi:hypothetical protein
MKTFRAAALLALVAIAAAPPAFAQFRGGVSGGQSASTITPAAPAPSRGFERGDFPLPIVPGFSDGREWRDGGRHGRPSRPDRPRRRDIAGFGGYGIGYGSDFNRDGGYFATQGETPAVANGRARYDYDRGYPYDYYRGGPERSGGDETALRDSYCETQWTRDRRSGEQVPVRVCRN